MKKKIILARNIGFCFGVRRAMDLVTTNLEKNRGPIYTLGPLIHNPQVMQRLGKRNLIPISGIEEIGKKIFPGRRSGVEIGKVLIRSHGVPREILAKLKRKKLKIIDATCPYVKRIQHLVNNLAKKNYTVIIFGKRDHPEVEALVSYAQGKAKVIEKVEDLPRRIGRIKRKIGLVSQTTQATEDFQKVASFFKSPLFRNQEVKIYNTLCPTTKKRQIEAAKIAGETERVLVVGGKNSSNTTRLAEICSRYQKNTYHIETAKEINPGYFRQKTKNEKQIIRVGIITGASTPDWIIKEVIKRVEKSIPGRIKK